MCTLAKSLASIMCLLWSSRDSPRFYCANNSKFRAWRYQSHTQLQLCQIRLYMVSKQTSRKNVAVKDFNVLFLIWLRVKNWRKLKQIKVIASLTPRKCCFHFTKKYFTAIDLFFEWIYLKNFSKIFGSMLCFVLFTNLMVRIKSSG